jgi:hypothetical protein
MVTRREKMRKTVPTTPYGVCISITTVGGADAAALINNKTRIFRIINKKSGGGG